MHALPFLLAVVSAARLAPPLLRGLREGGHTRLNYRDRVLPYPFGVLIAAAALVALIPLTLLARLASAAVFEPRALPIAVYALGVMLLGLIDDTLARARPEAAGGPGHRRFRGPRAARRRGAGSPGGRR